MADRVFDSEGISLEEKVKFGVPEGSRGRVFTSRGLKVMTGDAGKMMVTVFSQSPNKD